MDSNAEFDRYARTYEKLLRDPVRDRFVQTSQFYHRRKWALITEFLERHGLVANTLSWLDVGCGKGELLKYGASHFERIAGCDPSIEMVRGAAGIEVELQKAPDVLPFADATFDFVTAVCVFHHVQERNRRPLTCEIRRVLRASGVFCIIEHNPFNLITRWIVNRCPVDVGARLLAPRSARLYAQAAGFGHLETQYFLYLPERLYDKMAAVERLCRGLPLGGQYAMFARK